ncbi:MAG: phytanoyl-CoA dioxygenase family protein [Chloroflexota bacterium]
MINTTVQLTEAEIQLFHEQGFLVLEAITTPDEVAQLREIYDRLFRGKVGWDEGNQFDLAGTDEGEVATLPQILGPSRYEPALLNSLYLRNARTIAQQLLGDEMLPNNGEHMIYKPPKVGAATPWHQDQAYHDPNLQFQGVNFWLPLDNVTVESGCLQFVPGSHKLDVLPHHNINHDPRIHGLEVDEPEMWAAKAVPCPIPAGGATIHAAYMLHYAAANSTNHPRRAYTLTFRLPPTQRATPVDNYWMRNQRTARAERAAQARQK